jgi:hypothetical protein
VRNFNISAPNQRDMAIRSACGCCAVSLLLAFFAAIALAIAAVSINNPGVSNCGQYKTNTSCLISCGCCYRAAGKECLRIGKLPDCVADEKSCDSWNATMYVVISICAAILLIVLCLCSSICLGAIVYDYYGGRDMLTARLNAAALRQRMPSYDPVEDAYQ